MRRSHAEAERQWSSHKLSAYGLAKYIAETRRKSPNGRELLNLSYWPLIDADLSVVSNAGLGINSLLLRYCLRISDDGILHLCGMQRGVIANGLQSLDLTGCAGLTDRACHIIADCLPRLRSVNLSGCSGISDRGLCALLGGCKYLEQVHLQNLPRLSNPSIDAIRINIVMFRCLHIIGEFGFRAQTPNVIYFQVHVTDQLIDL